MISYRLILMRHAKSDWSTNEKTDFDRPLSGRGLENAASIGIWLKENSIIPDVITSSPAKRSKDTTFIVCEQLGIPAAAIIFDDLIYEASLADLLDIVTNYGQEATNLLLVGHNPGIDNLLNFLSKQQPQLSKSGKLMSTAAMAILDYGSGPIIARQKCAKLVQIVRPREL